jgi:hypothetical protein
MSCCLGWQKGRRIGVWRCRVVIARLFKRLSRAAIRPRYETRVPSPQTIADIFKNNWKSKLPNVEQSGDAVMFDDARVAWLANTLPGGLAGLNLCEIGPFEGYQTLALAQTGAASVTSVEANTFNFMKCLCLKEIVKFEADFELGDGLAYLKTTPKRFDLIFASGVLYHLQDPLAFLRAAMEKTDHLYLWTHYFQADRIGKHPKVARHFKPRLDRLHVENGQEVRLHARSYRIGNYLRNIPAYWEGGQQDITYWLEKEQLIGFLHLHGFTDIKLHADSDLAGMPVLSLCASRG